MEVDPSYEFGILIPPPEIKSMCNNFVTHSFIVFIDKTAGWIARKGSIMEKMVLERQENKDNPQFAFLKPGSAYYAYYQATVRRIRSEEVIADVGDKESIDAAASVRLTYKKVCCLSLALLLDFLEDNSVCSFRYSFFDSYYLIYLFIYFICLLIYLLIYLLFNCAIASLVVVVWGAADRGRCQPDHVQEEEEGAHRSVAAGAAATRAVGHRETTHSGRAGRHHQAQRAVRGQKRSCVSDWVARTRTEGMSTEIHFDFMFLFFIYFFIYLFIYLFIFCRVSVV
jgi:hypothetical protein